MLLRKANSQICALILTVLILVFSREAFSYDQIGKVININLQKQVAYTDLGNKTLAIGDTVRIMVSGGEDIILKVVGTSDQFSKLKPDQNSRAADASIFKAIQVGDDVMRVLASTATDQRKVSLQKGGQWTPVSRKVEPKAGYQGAMDDLVNDIQNLVTSAYSDDPQAMRTQQAVQEGFQPLPRNQEYQALVDDLNNYKSMYQQLQDKYDKLKNSSLQRNEEKGSNFVQIKEEVRQYRNEQQLLNKKVQTLRSELEIAEKKNRSFESRVQKYETEKFALNKKVNQLTGEVSRTQKKNLEYENKINDLKAANDQLKVKINSVINLIDRNI